MLDAAIELGIENGYFLGRGGLRRKVLYRRLIMKGYERKSIMHESDDIVPEDICGDFEVE